MSDSSQSSLVCNEEEKDAKKEVKSKAEGSPECAVCLQPSIHPVQLPCSHIFCYLCVKGATNQSKRCAMCRQEIPTDFLDNPHLLSGDSLESEVTFEDGYQWFYEGRNGWWQYDERTSIELETAYKRGENRCEVLIAGFLYIINFEHMVQMRRCDPTRRRHIKRDLATVPKKGVAGIRITSVLTNSNDTGELNALNTVPAEPSTDETDRVGQSSQNSGSDSCSLNAERQYTAGHSRLRSTYGQECSEGTSESFSHHTSVNERVVNSMNGLTVTENTSQRSCVINNGSASRSELFDTSSENEQV